jgi:hypothetical protein
MTRAADRRLVGFLAISAVLHLLALSLPGMSPPSSREPTGPLAVRLLPSPPERSAVAVRQAKRGAATPAQPEAAIVRAEAAVPEPATPAVNLDAAFATARRQALLPQPKNSLDAPRPLLTVEAAVARAMRPDVLVETRGAAGEYVTINGKTRCVTPLQVPHFLEGKTMLTQCETRKG